jgi:hypothetical protein
MLQKSLESIAKIVTALPQSAQAAGTLTSSAIDTKGFGDIVVLFPVGGVGASGTVNGTVTECDTSGGSYTAITGATFPNVITATTGPQAAGIGDDNCYGILLRQGSHKRFIKCTSTVATATMVGGTGVVVILFFPQDSELVATFPASGSSIAVAVG